MKPPLWAPWRMDYILSEKPEGCIFCDFPSQGVSLENLVLHVSPEAFVVLNRYPYINGHLMVIPRQHVSLLTDLDGEVLAATTRLLQVTSGILQDALSPEGMNIGLNQGRAAGAGIDAHLHFHIVPRWVGDTNYISAVSDTRVISQGLEDTWKNLRPHFEQYEIKLKKITSDGPGA